MDYNIAITVYNDEVEVKAFDKGVPVPGTFLRCNDYGVLPCKKESKEFDFSTATEKELDAIPTLEELEAKRERSTRESVRRSRQAIYDISRSYTWEWFLTFTFSPDSVDRYNYDDVSALMSAWLKKMRKLNRDMRYIVVPEQHKDGAYHFHGLFSLCDLQPKLWKRKIYNIPCFEYGYTTATRVRNSQAACRYISKYVTKDLCSVSYGKKRYWASRNISKPDSVRVASNKPGVVSAFKAMCAAVAAYKSQAFVFPTMTTIDYYHFKIDDFRRLWSSFRSYLQDCFLYDDSDQLRCFT